MRYARTYRRNPGVVLEIHTCQRILGTVIVCFMKKTKLRGVDDRNQAFSGCPPLSLLELFK